MKKICLAFLSVFALLNPLYAEEPKEPWSLDTNLAFYSEYMFRGFNLYDGASIQPSATLNYDTGDSGVLHTNLWMHLPGESNAHSENFSELDGTITYDYTVDAFTFTAGHVWYAFLTEPEGGLPETSEFFAAVSADTFLTPTFSVYHDYRAFDAQYYELLLSHTIEDAGLGEGFNLTPFVSFGFASKAEKLYENDGFVQTTIGFSSEAALGEITVVPSINYTISADDFIEDEFWVGLSFTHTFE